ncbi:MAG: acetyltransferase [Cyclobacteriaceae bacterium]|nr:acetyltransferase [Cyclobacteriaceae bacterium]
MKNIAIYGAGGFGKEVLTLIMDLINSNNRWSFIGFFDDRDCSDKLGKLYLGDYRALNNWSDPLCLVLAMGWSNIRSAVADRIQNPMIEFPPLISPKCIFGDARRVTIGKGSIIMAGANLTTDIAIGDFVLININATIGHDVQLADFCSVMPSANISGNVKMESGVFIGSGATVLQNIRIEKNSIVGAGAVVTKDVKGETTVVGIPARVIKRK